MPKTAANGSATMAGAEGVVQDASGQRWQLDPSRNHDGTVVDGFESDEREIDEERATPQYGEQPQLQPVDEPKQDEPAEAPAEDEKEDEKPPARASYSRSKK